MAGFPLLLPPWFSISLNIITEHLSCLLQVLGSGAVGGAGHALSPTAVPVSRCSDTLRRVHQPLLCQRPISLPAAGAAGHQRVRAAAALQQPGLLHVDDPALCPGCPGGPGFPAPQRLRARRPQATQHPVECRGGVL